MRQPRRHPRPVPPPLERPTPEEIRQRCADVQATWDAHTAESRLVGGIQHWTPPGTRSEMAEPQAPDAYCGGIP